MKKSILLAIILCLLCSMEAQNINSNPKDTTKTEKKEEGPKIYRRSRVITLLGYLHIFPYELGAFDNEPIDMINRINANTQYEYNTWRIPTNEEITVIKANGYADKNDKYMTRESENGRVLLVTDTEKAEELRKRDIERQKAIAEKERQERQKREEEIKKKREKLLSLKVDSLLQIKGFVDLDLPSGTLWNAQSEPCQFTFDMANMLYEGFLPTKKQCLELTKECDWTYVFKGKNEKDQWVRGYIVTGKNGNSIYIEDETFNSSTIDEGNNTKAWQLLSPYGTAAGVGVFLEKRNCRSQVRLVKMQGDVVISHEQGRKRFYDKTGPARECELQYVDLGLPSGTKWANFDSELNFVCTYYPYSESLEGIPTKQQWKELQKKCTWMWKDYGYQIVGPNGNYIFIAMDKHQSYSNHMEAPFEFAYCEDKHVYRLTIDESKRLKFTKGSSSYHETASLRKVQ